MLSRKSSGLIDLRKGRSEKPPSRGQAPLFSRGPRLSEKENKPMPLRARRRRVRALIALAILMLCGMVFWGVSTASYLPQFNIASVSVTGAQDVSEPLIRRYVEHTFADGSYHILSRDNIFLYPRQVIEQSVADFFPRIKSAHVSRASLFATAITVTVEERKPFALWCLQSQANAVTESECYVMDNGGYIFAKATASTSPQNQYMFGGGLASSTDPIGQSFVRAHLPGIISLFQYLGQAGFTPEGATIDGEQDFSVRLTQGFVLKASFGADAYTLAKNLQLVLSSDALKDSIDTIEYVDLRFGNRVYYKLKGQKEASTQ